MNVKEMIAELVKHDPEMPVVIRKTHGDGYFSDHEVMTPTEFFPGGAVCLCAGEQTGRVAAAAKDSQ